MGSHAELKIGALNDYVSDKETHVFDKCGNKSTEVKETTQTNDQSTEVLGLKVAGTTET